jgi:hypothetical protein
MVAWADTWLLHDVRWYELGVLGQLFIVPVGLTSYR